MNTIQEFEKLLHPDPFARTAPQDIDREMALQNFCYCPQGFLEFLNSAHDSYARGAIRFLIPDSTFPLDIWTIEGGWGEDWGVWRDQYRVFAYDWHGRLFAFDTFRLRGEEPLISLIDTGVGKSFNSKSVFHEFLYGELPSIGPKLLIQHFQDLWFATGGAVPLPHQCIGYKVPLGLGGADHESNLEVADITVYLSMTGQLAMSS